MQMYKDTTNNNLRPMMKISEMIPYLKNKNIKFEKGSEQEAESYLRTIII